MSDVVKQLEEQLAILKKGLFKLSPRDRVRALSTHENDDLILDLQDVIDDAEKSLQQLKS